MANKRMFSREIMESDRFVNLSQSARLLYVYINLNADDDGFTGRTRAIEYLANADDSDLQELIEADFIIRFDTGVIVVTDWKTHNTIQKDRYKETAYLDEKNMLVDGKKYKRKEMGFSSQKFAETSCKQNGNVEEERIEEVKEVRLEENRERVAVEKGEVQEGGTMEIKLSPENFGNYQPNNTEVSINACVDFYQTLVKGDVYPNNKKRIIEIAKQYGAYAFTEAIAILKRNHLDYSLDNIDEICQALTERRETVKLTRKNKKK